MGSRLALSLALWAALAPPPWGLAAVPVAAACSAPRAALAGLGLLALASAWPPPEPVASSPRAGVAARIGSGVDRLVATWTSRPGAVPVPGASDAQPPPGNQACAEETRGPSALRLRGRWRAPPASDPRLDTAAGGVELGWSSGLSPPEPGAWIEVLARVDERGRATAVSVHRLAPPSGAWIDRLAATARARLFHLAHGPRRALLGALLLGDRSELDGAVRLAFRATGTAHLLALSGLHVSLLAALAGRVLAAPLATLLLVLFTLVAGPRAPMLRALGTRLLAPLVARAGRPPAPLARLGLVALLITVVFGPEPVLGLSGRLSFLAVGGLLAGLSLGPTWLAGLLGPAGAVLATAPLCATVFGEVHWFGLLATPLLTPLVAAVLALGTVSVLAGPTFAALDPLVGPGLDALAGALATAVEWLATWAPPPLRPSPAPCDPTLLGLLVIAALAGLRRRRLPEYAR